jgi:hypothetical protein
MAGYWWMITVRPQSRLQLSSPWRAKSCSHNIYDVEITLNDSESVRTIEHLPSHTFPQMRLDPLQYIFHE